MHLHFFFFWHGGLQALSLAKDWTNIEAMVNLGPNRCGCAGGARSRTELMVERLGHFESLGHHEG